MRKKIIFFGVNLEMGGIENSLINLLNIINYDKYDVKLILEKKEGNLLSKLNKNVKVKEYRISNNKIVLFRKIYNFTKRFIWTIFNKNKYDFSCCYATYSLMGAKLSKIASSNSSIYIHSDYTNVYEKKDFYDFFEKRCINNFKKIIFVSNESQNNFLNYYPKLKSKTIVINNFIDDEKILKLKNQKIDIEKKHDKLFVFVGRLDESSKNITSQLKLIKNLKNKHSIELWIIGSGKDEKIYREYIEKYDLSDNIKMLGEKINPYPYMNKADYILLTSNYEGFPVVYLEAILLNKKIITTIDVSDEYINIKNFGYIVDKNNLEEQIDNILNLNETKTVDFNFNYMKESKIKALEAIFDEVKND